MATSWLGVWRMTPAFQKSEQLLLAVLIVICAAGLGTWQAARRPATQVFRIVEDDARVGPASLAKNTGVGAEHRRGGNPYGRESTPAAVPPGATGLYGGGRDASGIAAAGAQPAGQPALLQPDGPDAKVNINTAGVRELQRLPGVGKTRAEAIIADREKNGPFVTAEDLDRVHGFGEKMVEDLAPRVTTGLEGSGATPTAVVSSAPGDIPAGGAATEAAAQSATPPPAPAARDAATTETIANAVSAATPVSATPPPPGPTLRPPPPTNRVVAVPDRLPSGARRINLNSATQAQLETIPGVGPVLAREILAHRSRIGRFRSVDELKDVKGIGEARLRRMRDSVAVE